MNDLAAHGTTDLSSAPGVRFEATLHRGERQGDLKELPSFDLDRLPAPPGEVRVLLTAEDAARLVQRGFEVHLVRAYPVRPLDRSLVLDDGEAFKLLEERVQNIQRQGEK